VMPHRRSRVPKLPAGWTFKAGFTSCIVELDRQEGNAVLAASLRAHMAGPEFCARRRWKPNDQAFRDKNKWQTRHCATADGLPNRRVMRRAKILGDRPY